MEHLLIIDFEATCFQRGTEPPDFFSEIIEVGAVVFHIPSRTVVEEYQCFVKSVLFPELSPFCKELTTITQEQVDQGISLAQAVQEMKLLYEKY